MSAQFPAPRPDEIDRFAAYVADAVDGVAIHTAIRDDAGRIVDFRVDYANAALSRITGLPHDELVGHRILERFPGRRENGLFDAYVRVVETGEPMVRDAIPQAEATGRTDPNAAGRSFDLRVARLGDGYSICVRDATARRKAEDELFASQQMLRLVLDTIPQRVFWKDTNSVFVGCNAAFARNLNLDDPAELVGRTDYDLGDRAEADIYCADDKRVMESGVPKIDYEEPHSRADGSEGWAHTSKVPLRDKAGRVIGLLGTYEDVTDRKRAAEALRESEGFLASIIENIPIAVFVKDARTLRFVRLNRAGERMLGYSREELVDQDDQGLVPADETAFFGSVDQQVLETGCLVDVPEESLTTPHDGVRVCHTTKIPIFGEDGKPRFVLGISEDITERRAIEEARRDSEARYRHMIDSITDYVVSVKIENGQAVSVSHGPGCVAVTGHTSEELRAEPGLWTSLVLPEDRGIVSEAMRRILAGERIGPVEHRIRRKDGALRWVRHTPVLRFEGDGTVVAYDGLIQDITERRALQDQLLQAQKMEGIGRLAGGVAHDFNNLLTAILGYVEMAGHDLPAELPADHPARQDLLEVAVAGERAAGLTRQLLAFASRQIVAPVRLDVNALVADSLKMLRRLLGDDIEMETSFGASLGTIEADPGQIQQLLVNLAVNARDAMPGGGRLLIETANETIDEEAARARPGAVAGPHVMLAVTDAGVGMGEEVQAHLFEPFFTTKEMGKGTGLGLATCHGIVRQIGGHIAVYSELGRGTTFRIYLPRKAGPADPEPARASSAPAPDGTETILVVEDEPGVRRLALLGLRARGYVVFEAANAAEAMAIARRASSTIDLIVSDVVMPGMSGPDLIRQLAAIAPQARAMLMSGHAESAVLPQSLALRYAFLPKPFTPERLARKVREVLDSTEKG
jgi:two-component system, cell cycle sensor histidine kinase and response regulator CckA